MSCKTRRERWAEAPCASKKGSGDQLVLWDLGYLGEL